VAKVTSKLQVTLPKSLAAQYGIEPGSDIEWQAAGDVIRVLPASARRVGLSTVERLALFDAATSRQKVRQRGRVPSKAVGRGKRATGAQDEARDRGWTREDLYDRGAAR
jgi:bifunctional DNA-binding transcriptional regulator/antitoxin component of YhaV-PrlF toxin-antitoxin module